MALTPYGLVFPSFALASFVILCPLAQPAVVASHDENRFGILRDFVGVDNFRHVLADPLFQASLLTSI